MSDENFSNAVSTSVGANRQSQMLVILFIPTKDRNNTEIRDIDMWLDGAISMISKTFGGATVMAPASGAWVNPDTKEVIREEVHLIHSYGTPDSELRCFEPIAEFMHMMGRKTNQGEMGLVVDGVFHHINEYRKAPLES